MMTTPPATRPAPPVPFPGRAPGNPLASSKNSILRLENSVISATWSTAGGRLALTSVSNKLTQSTHFQQGTECFRISTTAPKPIDKESALVAVHILKDRVVVTASADGNAWTDLASFPRSEFKGEPTAIRIGKMNLKAEAKSHSTDGPIGTSTISDITPAVPMSPFVITSPPHAANVQTIAFPKGTSVVSARIAKGSDTGMSWAPELRNEARSYFGSGAMLAEIYLTPELLRGAAWDTVPMRHNRRIKMRMFSLMRTGLAAIRRFGASDVLANEWVHVVAMKSRVFTAIVCVVLTQSGCMMGKSNAPQATVDAGRLEGRREGSLNVFKGIPYAAPPIGRLRWRAPQPVPKWSGVRKAVRYGNDAPQKFSAAPNQSEDCLFLNVWAPSKRESKPLPVMVWIHGGGFTQGSGRIRGEALADQGVVFVSMNYRLGRFGFFAHPSLDRDRPVGEPPGNFGLQDQIAALRWIQRNIAQFGGDSKRVTIFGVSAGGTSVNLLMASPLAQGLFQRAISQSGIGGFGPYRRWNTPHLDKEPMTAVGEAYAKSLGITSPETAATQLRALPWRTVAEVGTTPAAHANFETVVDGVTLLDDPQRTFERGLQNPVPFIAGFNSYEGNLSQVIPWTDQPPRKAVAQRIDRLAPLYNKKTTDPSLWNNLYGDVYFGLSTILLVREMETVKTPSWTYYFDYVRKRGRNSQGAGHGSEVPFLFDQVIFAGESDKRMIYDMQGHWIQFAKSGNPNRPGLPNWPAHMTNKPITMVYGQTQRKAESNWLSDRFSILFEALDETWPRD